MEPPVITDTLYRKIVEGRCRDNLDDQIVEPRAANLLRDDHPTLVLVAGGGDAGRNEAIGTPDAAYARVCTVGKDAIGDLRRNLQA